MRSNVDATQRGYPLSEGGAWQATMDPVAKLLVRGRGHDKGRAVVATEVRALPAQTASVACHIGAAIGAPMAVVRGGIGLMP